MRTNAIVEKFSFLFISNRCAAAPFVLLFLSVAQLFAASPALAQTGASSAFGETVNLAVAPSTGRPIRVSSGPLPVVGGSGAAAYNVSNQVASATVSAPTTGQILGTGLITVHASSSLPGAPLMTAESKVDNLNLNLAGAKPLLTVQAKALESSVQLGGSCAAAPIASGSATLAGLRLGGSLGLGLAIPANPLPNTVLLDLVGIRVVLNEQIVAQSAGTWTMTVNALHISVDALPTTGLGFVTSDVVIAQAKASMACPALSGADLAVTVVDDSTGIKAGTLLTYTVEATNNGPLSAVGTTLIDTLSSGVALLTVDSTLGSCTPGAVVVCDLGDLAPGDHATIIMVVETTLSGNLLDTVSVSSTTPDPNLADNHASMVTPVAPGDPEIVAHPRTE